MHCADDSFVCMRRANRNALLYGAKKWFLYPPSDMIMSSRQIREFVEEGDMKEFAERGVKVTTCVQVAGEVTKLAYLHGYLRCSRIILWLLLCVGDVMIVPESWGHGVLNVQVSIRMHHAPYKCAL